MLNELKRKEIKILKTLQDTKGDIYAVVNALSVGRRDYYRLVEGMKKKNVYPMVDFRKGQKEIEEFLAQYPFDLVITFISTQTTDDYYFDESTAYESVRKHEINGYVQYIQNMFKIRCGGDVFKLLNYWYDRTEEGEVPETFILDTIYKIGSRKNCRTDKLKALFSREAKRYQKKVVEETAPVVSEILNTEEEVSSAVEALVGEDYTEILAQENTQTTLTDLVDSKTLESLKLLSETLQIQTKVCELQDFVEKWHREICKTDKGIIMGLEESYRGLIDRDLPALEWMEEAFDIVLRKHETGSISSAKKCINYFVQIIRNWENYGKGNVGRLEDKLLLRKLEIESKCKLTNKQKSKLYTMMGRYGVVLIYATLAELGYSCVDMDLFLDKILPARIEKLEKQTINY